jgi:putative spermidine/putrescine transport system ATP-binding protein
MVRIAPMTQLSINKLTKRFDDVLAVDAIDLEIADGELISLLGPSGCGKTTTLRCIAGFETPSAGHILFDGRDIVGLAPEHRNIGMVFQNYALFPHMTVSQNLAFGLEMRSVAKAEIAVRVERALATVQLAGYGERYPKQLSGGQQQRVALARALVIEPSILLLDEPLANLDAKLREEMRFFIRSLQKEVGITTVYVTHDQAEAMVISDRIVVMFDGVINQIGGPTAIYQHPITKQVADFIGLSNFIPATVSGPDDEGHYNLDTPLGTLCCAYDGALSTGAQASVIVRPEAIDLAADLGGDARNSAEGEVVERYYLGNIAGYKVACAADVVLQVQAPPWASYQVGDRVWCRFDSDKAWVIKD